MVDFTNTSADAESPITDLTFQWTFGDGSAPSTDRDPSHTYAEAGEYTVVMNLGGPAGTTAAALTIEVKKTRGTGCDTAVGAGSAGIAGALAGLLVLFRRRRG